MINNVTKVQKEMFLALAKKYDADVYKIVARGNAETIEITDDGELAEIELFADKIVTLVGNDYPDDDGADRDINDDAVAVAFLCSRVISDYRKQGKTNQLN